MKTKSSQCIGVVHNIDDIVQNIDGNETHWIRILVIRAILMNIVQNIHENEMHWNRILVSYAILMNVVHNIDENCCMDALN